MSKKIHAVETPLPGIVTDLRVNIGDKVAEGDVVLILEAMKMENEIISEVDGVVKEINVKVGDFAEAGKAIVYVEQI